jgi:diguanylate cyclase (GGDEF)-like protein
VEPDPAGGQHHRLYGAVQDFTERMTLMQRFERQAQRDFLTGLINRGHFLELAEKELARVRRYGGALSIAMIDLDHFKQVNDTYGHATGDQVLKAFATVGQRVLRESDLLGRMGGEEFAILFPETSAQQAFDVADRLREAVAATDIPSLQGASIRITVSIGIASMIDAKTSVDQLLNLADGALYQAKSEGRNRTLVAASG